MNSSGRALRIVHVSADYPDPVDGFKTPVIRSLRDLVADRFDQDVISLNRVAASPGDLTSKNILRRDVPFDHGRAWAYAAPPLGILHRTRLEKLGDRLAEELDSGPRPDLIVGHKLTVEGIAVARCAKRLDIPYAITVQGNTDCKIVASRPDLRRCFGAILRGAAAVFCFAPWAWTRLGRTLDLGGREAIMLPCPTDVDTAIAPRTGDGSLVSVFHLHNWRGKNLRRLAGAARQLPDGHRLAIIGGGSEAHRLAARRAVGTAPDIVFEGPLDHSTLSARLNRATGFALPSLRESFGLVFVEALFAGLPIVYPADTAVDGWFDGLPFAVRVDARDADAIAAAMTRLVADEIALKQELSEWQRSEDGRRFTRPAIAARFEAGLRAAIG